ncbi:MAG: HD domain-containing phosphohydrolase [Sulfurimonas sp.]|jgi:HD-GYP domain-containing protein (c-di-GMP phosphodiesterase class II)
MLINSDNKEINNLLISVADKIQKLSAESDDNKIASINIILETIKTFGEKKTEQISHLNEIGAALSTETEVDNLLDMIISKGKLFTNADGGTLYMISEDEKSLLFRIVETDSLGIKMGANGEKISWPPLPLYLEDGSYNHQMVAAHCAIESKIINFEDVYNCEGFNFEGTKKFDASTGFHSQSMLVVPMINNDKDVIGVLQLLNARNSDGEVTGFTKEDEKIVMSLTSQAAIAITNAKMIHDLKELLESFIKSIAFAVDQKSPYTGGHVEKVAILSLMIADALNSAASGKYADVKYSEDELDEIRISALMHDVGKITTPQHVMDKATKLETVYDRINTIRIKFELLKRDLEIEMLNKKIKLIESGASSDEIKSVEDELEEEIDILDEEISFLVVSNIGGEFMTNEHIKKIEEIAQRKVKINEIKQNILSTFEVQNLCIRKGTLTDEELAIMRDHARVSNEMLDALPFPKHLKRVPAIAGGHHEKLNGKGYPKGLTADDLSLESRILALSDIFEALSASDRPYKDGKKMSEVMKIISFMIKDGELDADLVQFFYDEKLHLKFAAQCFKPAQIDVS